MIQNFGKREAKMIAKEILELSKNEFLYAIREAAKEVAKDQGDEWMTTKQAAEFLGLSERTLRNKGGRFPGSFKINGRRLYSKNAITDYARNRY